MFTWLKKISVFKVLLGAFFLFSTNVVLATNYPILIVNTDISSPDNLEFKVKSNVHTMWPSYFDTEFETVVKNKYALKDFSVAVMNAPFPFGTDLEIRDFELMRNDGQKICSVESIYLVKNGDFKLNGKDHMYTGESTEPYYCTSSYTTKTTQNSQGLWQFIVDWNVVVHKNVPTYSATARVEVEKPTVADYPVIVEKVDVKDMSGHPTDGSCNTIKDDSNLPVKCYGTATQEGFSTSTQGTVYMKGDGDSCSVYFLQSDNSWKYENCSGLKPNVTVTKINDNESLIKITWPPKMKPIYVPKNTLTFDIDGYKELGFVPKVLSITGEGTAGTDKIPATGTCTTVANKDVPVTCTLETDNRKELFLISGDVNFDVNGATCVVHYDQADKSSSIKDCDDSELLPQVKFKDGNDRELSIFLAPRMKPIHVAPNILTFDVTANTSLGYPSKVTSITGKNLSTGKAVTKGTCLFTSDKATPVKCTLETDDKKERQLISGVVDFNIAGESCTVNYDQATKASSVENCGSSELLPQVEFKNDDRGLDIYLAPRMKPIIIPQSAVVKITFEGIEFLGDQANKIVVGEDFWINGSGSATVTPKGYKLSELKGSGIEIRVAPTDNVDGILFFNTCGLTLDQKADTYTYADGCSRRNIFDGTPAECRATGTHKDDYGKVTNVTCSFLLK